MARPLNVILDLTERCNLKCRMCYFAETDRLRWAPFDRALSKNGNMPLDVFDKVAADLFPRAWRVALGCAAEPMLHSKFREVLAIAARYKIPDLWFPTNLLALTEATAEAIVDAGVATVAASIDGVTQETYEHIRVGAKWERLLSRLALLTEVRRRRGGARPELRIIFTWMRSNRSELQRLPAFAEEHGATQLDVRYVTPTVGVDVSPELLPEDERPRLHAELAAAARDAVSRGIRLTSYPEFETVDDVPSSTFGRLRRHLWRYQAGLIGPEHWRAQWHERRQGCAFPDRTIVVRPNGSVAPCIFWDEQPIGLYPQGDFAGISSGEPLKQIREGLRCGEPAGTCARCDQRRKAFYRPFYRRARTTT